MISTTGDLSRFFSALLGGRLLHPAQLAEMKVTVRATELDPAWPGARYGLGLMEIPLSCGGATTATPVTWPGLHHPGRSERRRPPGGGRRGDGRRFGGLIAASGEQPD